MEKFKFYCFYDITFKTSFIARSLYPTSPHGAHKNANQSSLIKCRYEEFVFCEYSWIFLFWNTNLIKGSGQEELKLNFHDLQQNFQGYFLAKSWKIDTFTPGSSKNQLISTFLRNGLVRVLQRKQINYNIFVSINFKHV